METPSFVRTIRFKVIGLLAVMFLGLLGGMLVMNMADLRSNSGEQEEQAANLLASAVYNGIIQPMSIGDGQTIREQMAAFAKMPGVEVAIFGFDQEVSYATDPAKVQAKLPQHLKSQDLAQAVEALLANNKNPDRPFEETLDGKPHLAVVHPMANEKRCHHCHGESKSMLGGVLVRKDITHSRLALERLRNRNLLAGGLGGLVSIMILYFIITRLVARPSRRLASMAQALAGGDLTWESGVSQRDSLGRLALGLDQVSSNLRQMIGLVARQSDRLSQGATSQAAAVEETAASTEQMASQIKRNADNAQQASQLMNDTVGALERARQAMRTLENYMNETSADSDQVGKVIRTIQQVAFQTNLLALNAAVEAARAGEAGAGFAVVAQEVRALAGKSAEAAQDTERLVGGIVDKVKHAAQLVQRTDGEYREVAVMIKKAGGLVGGIADASREQAQGIEQVNRAMGDIDKATQAQATVAMELAEAMTRFKTEEGQARPALEQAASNQPPALTARSEARSAP